MGQAAEATKTVGVKRRRLLAASGAALALGVLVASAYGTFTAPVDLSAAGQNATTPEVATDADGDSIAVWLRPDGTKQRVQARTISAAGALGPVRNLSAAGENAFEAQVATDADGDSIAVWRRAEGARFRIQARTISAAGALGAVRNLSAATRSAFRPQVATDADGDSIAVWRRVAGVDFLIQARTISAVGTLGPIRNLSAGADPYQGPQVATDADGDSIAVWARVDGANDLIQARTISAAGALGSVKTLSAAGADADSPRVATDADGDSIAVWRRFDGADYRVQARTVSAGGSLGAILDLSDSGNDAFEPQVATDADGDAIAIWRRRDDAGYPHYRIKARTVSGAGSLGLVRTLSAGGENAYEPQVATDAGGDSIAAWHRYDGSDLRVQARAVPATGPLGTTEDLSAAGQGAVSPQVATDADGDSIVVWQRVDGVHLRVQVSQGP